MNNINDFEKLVELFKDCTNNIEDEEAEEVQHEEIVAENSSCKANQSNKKPEKVNPYMKIPPPERPHQILDSEATEEDEILYFEESSEELNKKSWKDTPKWDISYRQSVTANDIFLGMSFKNPSTSSCENMVITVQLPGENRQNIDLKIEKETLTLTSPKFYLNLNLPHPVDPKKGNAQFDNKAGNLNITLVMDRELDLLNF